MLPEAVRLDQDGRDDRDVVDTRAGEVPEPGAVPLALLCEIMADPKHPEHEERKEWVGGGGPFDPERFELKPVNAALFKYLKR